MDYQIIKVEYDKKIPPKYYIKTGEKTNACPQKNQRSTGKKLEIE